jgi:hypothetical protein
LLEKFRQTFFTSPPSTAANRPGVAMIGTSKAVALCVAMMLALSLAPRSHGADLPKNDFIGSLPSMYIDYKDAEKASEDRLDKQRKEGSTAEYVKLREVEDKATEERDAKFAADQKAEWVKAVGKDIPFSTSKEFDKLQLEIKSVKFADDIMYFNPVIVAKKDFTVSVYDDSVMVYKQLAFNFLAKDGSKIADGLTGLIYVGPGEGLQKSFKEGEEIPIDRGGNWLDLSINKEQWANFASIQFITPEER